MTDTVLRGAGSHASRYVTATAISSRAASCWKCRTYAESVATGSPSHTSAAAAGRRGTPPRPGLRGAGSPSEAWIPGVARVTVRQRQRSWGWLGGIVALVAALTMCMVDSCASADHDHSAASHVSTPDSSTRNRLFLHK